MFFGILLASLGRLANLLSNHFPLVVLVLLDGAHEGLALYPKRRKSQYMVLLGGKGTKRLKERSLELTSSSANSA